MSRIEECGKVVETNFRELGLETSFVKGTESPCGDTLWFNLKYVSDYNKNYIKSLLEKIAVYHHLDMTFYESRETHFKVFVEYGTSNKVSLIGCLNDVGFKEIAIGKDSEGKVATIDFEKNSHVLIGGATGSGKSVLLHDIICGIYVRHGANRDVKRFRVAEIYIIDPKYSDLGIYKNCVGTRYIDETEDAIQLLKDLCAEMNKRYREGYVRDTYIIIDELADLMLNSRFDVEEYIVRLAQKGRACGIHLIVATQRPSCDVVSGLIKANMPYRIALKTASSRDSVIILDHKGCETLRGCGDCIIKDGSNEIRCQIALAENELKQKIVSECRAK